MNRLFIKNLKPKWYNISCGNGGKWAISVAGDACAVLAACEGRISPKTEIAFPHEPHILFLVAPLLSSIIAKVIHYAGIYSTVRLFFENNFIKQNNMNIRCNQKFMFCNFVRTVVYILVSRCAGDTRVFELSTFRDFYFTTLHYEDSHFTTRWMD